MVFSESFVSDLKIVNDKKTRTNHETGSTHKHIWIHAALAYNNQQEHNVMHTVNEVIIDTFDMAAAVATEFDTDATDDESLKVGMVLAVPEQDTTNKTNRHEFSLIVVPTNDLYLADFEENDEINLEQFGVSQHCLFRRKVVMPSPGLPVGYH